MSMSSKRPASAPVSTEPTARPVAADPLTRFLGGPPFSVIFRLILLCILVGIILQAIGLDPQQILSSLRNLLSRIWDMGFDAVHWLWRYLLLGAAVVVPVWLIIRLSRMAQRR